MPLNVVAEYANDPTLTSEFQTLTAQWEHWWRAPLTHCVPNGALDPLCPATPLRSVLSWG